jgi:hypothetical protein
VLWSPADSCDSDVVVMDAFGRGGFLSLPQRPPLGDSGIGYLGLGRLPAWWLVGHGARGGGGWGARAGAGEGGASSRDASDAQAVETEHGLRRQPPWQEGTVASGVAAAGGRPGGEVAVDGDRRNILYRDHSHPTSSPGAGNANHRHRFRR